MDDLKRSIDTQIESNQGKNLFHEAATQTLQFVQGTIRAIESISGLSDEQVSVLIEYASDKALREFCRINQYFTFNSVARQELRSIYTELFLNIKNKKASGDSIREVHFRNIQQWLQQTNPCAEKLYLSGDEDLQAIPCAEYSAAIQVEILQMDLSCIMEPVLDIGCGRHGNLVKCLRDKGLEAYGFDRLPDGLPYLTSADWLEFQYGVSKWGTIVSHLGFSNHFHHHHLREDGDFVRYAEKYMEILGSLKQGGSFHYAPGLQFIEAHLNRDLYGLSEQPFGNERYKSIMIIRLY
ncbi:MAG: hypothetical protein IPH20_17765 [Bacteroidales bacterium]|nr:hypothetical protein [Bacteroidales bacterium]